MVQACHDVVKEWLAGRLKPSQIAILSPKAQKDTTLAHKKSLLKIPMTQQFEKWQAGEGVLFATISAFKGLEAAAVVIFGTPTTDHIPNGSRAEFYVACSRAKHLLAVLTLRKP